jgi:hypothetical protein
VEKLLSLGANAKLKTDKGTTPFSLAKDLTVQGLLRPAYEEMQRESAQLKLEKEHQKAAGAWALSPGSTAEVVHQYEAPVGQYKITDIFNFETERLITLTKDLDNDKTTTIRQAFKDVSAKEKAQAKAKLEELVNGSAAAAEEASAATPETPPAQRKDAYQYLAGSV